MEENTQLHVSTMFLLLIIRQIKDTSGLGWHSKGRDSYLTHQNLCCSCPVQTRKRTQSQSTLYMLLLCTLCKWQTNGTSENECSMGLVPHTHSWTCVQQWKSGKQIHHSIPLWPYKMVYGNTKSMKWITLTEKSGKSEDICLLCHVTCYSSQLARTSFILK